MILHLSKYYYPYFGGLEKVVQDLAENPTDNTPVTVICNSYEVGKTEEVKINNVKVVRCPIVFSLMSSQFSLSYFLALGKRINNSIVHIHLPNPFSTFFVLLYLLIGKSCKGLVVHWHSDVVSQKIGWFFLRPFVNSLLKRCDKIIVTSPAYLEYSVQLKNFKSKCEVIPIGIDTIELNVDNDLVKEIKNNFTGRKIVFSLGRHTYYKGFDLLIEAVRDGFDDSVFLIGGTGELTDEYKAKVDEYDISAKVFFLGRLSEVEMASYFAAAEVFCFPSCERSEAFGLVQLEAMSVGTPVISANIEGSGVPWVNKHLESGLVFENRSVIGLRKALSQLLNDNELLNKLSVGAKSRFNRNFTTENMTGDINSIYTDILDGKS
ncbi:glycosyltransferase [Agarivorans sp. 1_MG-2023]|uniref:glycosyltransferase n=1 Tax=Agarivorans sp. 1_MG-2023 TaxID=3062634 RepID=UPI0026E38770|nr:glycosyltransferase [Agarivorans sp. 1_MG-2023]MDO6764804.1 glycosyltransferase [Agarivorans sp. 1_MG-2023]